MTLDDFRAALRERGGHADIWLVYIEDLYETVFGGIGLGLRPLGAFWRRRDAYSLTSSTWALASGASGDREEVEEADRSSASPRDRRARASRRCSARSRT